MKNLFLSVAVCLLFFSFGESFGQNKKADGKEESFARENLTKISGAQQSPALQAILERAVSETIEKFKDRNLKTENIAATLIDLRDSRNPKTASVRGEQKIYPASVVKLFYMAALHQWLEDGKLKLTPELERGLKNMIVDSSNDATNYIFDVLTETSGGAELSAKELKKYARKRNAVNRYFLSLGYENINVNQKTYYEDAYGREQQFRDGGKNRNMLTTNATARLLAEIVTGKIVSPERSRQMMNLLRRNFTGVSNDADDQARGFTGIALNDLNLTGARLWSKAGWTSKTRHDAAYIETEDGSKFVLVVFTENVAFERGIIPSVARVVLQNIKNAN